MNSRYLLFIMLCLAFSSVSAKNFYVGLNGSTGNFSGKFSVIDQRLNPSVGITELRSEGPIDKTLKGYSLLAGYKLGSDTAFEVGVVRGNDIVLFSDTDYTYGSDGETIATIESFKEKVESNYVYAAFIGVWPLQNGWAITGRVGFSIYDVTFKQVYRTEDRTVEPIEIDRVVQTRFTDTAAGSFIGLGVSYGLAPNVELKLAIEQHNVDFAFTNLTLEGDLVLGTLGVAYHF